MDKHMELFTERYKLKDIIVEMEKSDQKEVKKDCKNFKDLLGNISKSYNLKEEDVEYIVKKTPLKAEDIKIEEGERAAIRYINTADVDRDDEIVLPDGAQVKDFQKSMTVLYAHNYRGLPIGRDLWIKLIEGKGWLAKTVYAEHQLAVDIYNMVKEHFLNTNSIGFIPLEWVKPDSKGWDKVKEKLMKVYGIKEKLIDTCRCIYTKWILLEHSDVPVPCNINALNIAVGKGFIKDAVLLKDIKYEIELIESKEVKKEEDKVEDAGKKLVEDIAKKTDKEILELGDEEEDEKVCPECGADVKMDEGGDDFFICTECDWNDANEGSKEAITKEFIKYEDIEKPYPTEHACRLKDPKLFQPDSFRRVKRESDGKVYSIIMGKLKGETKMTEQAYRYNKDIWSVAQARKHCKDHKGTSFEPAGKELEDTGKEVKSELLEIKEREITVNITGMKEMVAMAGENAKLKKRVEELEVVLKDGLKETIPKEKEESEEDDGIEIEMKKKEDTETDLNSDQIEDIIVKVIKEQAGVITKELKVEIVDSFKRATGKVL